MRHYTHRLTLMGRVVSADPDEGSFCLRCRSGEEFAIRLGRETAVSHLRNLDGLEMDRVPDFPGFDPGNPRSVVKKYIRLDRLILVEGIHQVHGDAARLDARTVYLTQDKDGEYLFEKTHWWLSQMSYLADRWLHYLFGPAESLDYSRYVTDLGVTGLPTSDIQECATLSRLIYGFSSAYLLTGCQRYLDAAQAGVHYQRDQFRTLSHDGEHIIWAFGKQGGQKIIPSRGGDDYGAIPLYEQIYALAGLTQFYRVTQEWEVLHDIERTLNAFERFYHDAIQGGYYSHIDYATMDPLAEKLGDNRRKKNWNSIGDHIPAYLINLILALTPLPQGAGWRVQKLKLLLEKCRRILHETATLIAEKFPDPESPLVRERFLGDWTPDPHWRWQRDRGVCGHNLKIAWNLTRVAFDAKNQGADSLARQLMAVASKLGRDMGRIGVDQYRSGVFDVIERRMTDDELLDFAWWNSKDFWQQEQGILAYLVLHGWGGGAEELAQARELMSFWNAYFLDHDEGGVYFRVTDDGLPYLRGREYRAKGGHSISGYHTFELNYLAHIYIRTFVSPAKYCLHFKPTRDCGQRSVNVLPDFLPTDRLRVSRVVVNGVERVTVDPKSFQIPLSPDELGAEVVVELDPIPSKGV